MAPESEVSLEGNPIGAPHPERKQMSAIRMLGIHTAVRLRNTLLILTQVFSYFRLPRSVQLRSDLYRYRSVANRYSLSCGSLPLGEEYVEGDQQDGETAICFLTLLEQDMASADEGGKRAEVDISTLKGKLEVAKDKLVT